jgi:hypothetical protein
MEVVMHKIALICFLNISIISVGSLRGEPVCRRCEQIREENKGKINPYFYYEDYLKEHPEAVTQKNEEEKSKDNSKSKDGV